MKICLQCHDEYRDEINTCVRCSVELAQHDKSMPLPTAIGVGALDMTKAIKVLEGTLPNCKEVEALLKHKRLPCQIVPVTAGNVINYAVCIEESRVPDFAAIMQARFSGMVHREHEKEFAFEDVNLDGGEVTCPACGHVGLLQDGQCADCGLMLGVTEPACS